MVQYYAPYMYDEGRGVRTGSRLAKKLGLKSSRFHEKNMSSNAQKAIDKIKLKDRDYMSLEQWSTRGHFRNQTLKGLRNFDKKLDTIDRVDYENFSTQEFIDRYESKRLPVIFTNSINDWNVKKITKKKKYDYQVDRYWTFEELYRRYSEVNLKIAEDSNGSKLRIPMKYFLEYLVYNQDDSPLYLFESAVEDLKDGGKDMIKHYRVPKLIQDDIFGLVGEKKRPPYRWFLIGPARSGTTVHIDPLQTSAWNTMITGHKLWVIFPPHIPKSIVKGKGLVARGEVKSDDQDEAIDWFTSILPKIIEKEGLENLQMIQTIQGPGETIFIPGGWWHAVLNLDDTIAVTQNFMSRVNFDQVWSSVKQERPKFSKRLQFNLKKNDHELSQRIKLLNRAKSMSSPISCLDTTQIISERDEQQDKVIVLDGQIKRIRRLSSDSEERSSSSSSSSGTDFDVDSS